jgi:hypothetical protein
MKFLLILIAATVCSCIVGTDQIQACKAACAPRGVERVTISECACQQSQVDSRRDGGRP